MRTTKPIARLWTIWLAVLTIGTIVAAGAHAAGGRVLARQDVLSIKVVNQPDMDTTTRVETDGTINFPYVGRIRAAGVSEDQLSRAGGVRDVGVGGTITVRRAGGSVRMFNSRDVEAGRGPGANLQIANNDEVFVDFAPFYYLYGYVNKTGEYPLIRPLTVQQAISIGGGLATLGSEWRI